MSTPDQADLLKLSRAQLKQLCRERGHTGYSKCTKPQLVALLGSDTPFGGHPVHPILYELCSLQSYTKTALC